MPRPWSSSSSGKRSRLVASGTWRRYGRSRPSWTSGIEVRPVGTTRLLPGDRPHGVDADDGRTRRIQQQFAAHLAGFDEIGQEPRLRGRQAHVNGPLFRGDGIDVVLVALDQEAATQFVDRNI